MAYKKLFIPLALIALCVAMLLWSNDSDEQKRYFVNQGLVFGTHYTIQYEATRDLEPEIRLALAQVDTALSMFNQESVLSKINQNQDVTTSADFEAVYQLAMEVSAASNGALDMTVAPLVNLWGFGLRNREQVTAEQVDSLLPLVDYQGVSLVDHHIRKNNPNIMLDAGAVAKGYGCDKVANTLREYGVENLLVEIGGEVVAQGKNSKGMPWSIGITKPIDDPLGAQTELQDIVRTDRMCMATSGNYRNFYFDGDQRRSHTIDPRTGYPVQHNLLSATVVASSCGRADAIATACMVLGADEAIRMVDKMEDVACYLILADENGGYRVETSSRWNYTHD